MKKRQEILPELTKELVKGMVQRREEASVPWYVILVLDKDLILGEVLYQCITESSGIYPVSVIFADTSRERIPKSCRFLLTGKSSWER